MSLLNEAVYREKLVALNCSAASIEQTSAWCVFHRDDARRVAEVWEDHFSKADQPKRLAMVYLANDILQTGRKGGIQFQAEFFKVLPRALRHMLAKSDSATREKVNKVIRVWDQRKVFGSSGSKTFHELVNEAEVAPSPAAAHAAPQHQAAAAVTAAPLAGPAAQLADTLAAAVSAVHSAAQLLPAVAAAAPGALSAAAGPQQVSAARQAAQGLLAVLQQELASRQRAAAQLRQLLAEQEAGIAAAAAQAQACSDQMAQLDARLAQLSGAASAGMHAYAPQQQQQQQQLPQGAPAQPALPAQQQAQPWAAPTPAPAGVQQVQQQAQQQGHGDEQPANEAAVLAAALTQDENSAEALLKAFMSLPQDQQEGLGAELAGILQQPEGGGAGVADMGMAGGDDLYDPEDL